MTDDQIHKFYELMTQTTPLGRDNIRSLYLDLIGERNIPFCSQFYDLSRDASVREDMVRFVIRYSRKSSAALELGIRALKDRSKHVKRNGCAVLAYSLNDEMVKHLKPLVSSKDPFVNEKAVAAISAIQNKDINLFVAPTHDAWHVTEDRKEPPTREDIDYYIRKNLPALIEPIEDILGTLYPK